MMLSWIFKLHKFDNFEKDNENKVRTMHVFTYQPFTWYTFTEFDGLHQTET